MEDLELKKEAREYVRTLSVAGINAYNHCDIESAFMYGYKKSENKVDIKKLDEIIKKFALLTAACEGNMYHERTVINESIFEKASEIYSDLISIKD